MYSIILFNPTTNEFGKLLCSKVFSLLGRLLSISLFEGTLLYSYILYFPALAPISAKMGPYRIFLWQTIACHTIWRASRFIFSTRVCLLSYDLRSFYGEGGNPSQSVSLLLIYTWQKMIDTLKPMISLIKKELKKSSDFENFC